MESLWRMFFFFVNAILADEEETTRREQGEHLGCPRCRWSIDLAWCVNGGWAQDERGQVVEASEPEAKKWTVDTHVTCSRISRMSHMIVRNLPIYASIVCIHSLTNDRRDYTMHLLFLYRKRNKQDVTNLTAHHSYYFTGDTFFIDYYDVIISTPIFFLFEWNLEFHSEGKQKVHALRYRNQGSYEANIRLEGFRLYEYLLWKQR